jgi:hypothetical protein
MGVPTDREVVAILRKRLNTVEQAAEAFLKVLDDTGTKRREAHRAMVAQDVHGLPDVVDTFLSVYENTLEPRRLALEAFTNALVTDFYTALLQCEDVTDEQIAAWFEKQDAPESVVA